MKCENCSSEHDGNYGSGRFCNKKCARGFSTKAKRKEINAKVSAKAKAKFEIIKMARPPKKPKTFNCPITGEQILDMDEYIMRRWSARPGGRIKTAELLAKTFNIKFGNLNVINELNNARENLRCAYVDEKLSGSALKKKYDIDCSGSHILNFLRALGIKRHTKSQANILALECGRANIPQVSSFPYKSGWHDDWQGNKHYYRSSYELVFYLDLDKQQIPYQTESERIRYFDSQKQSERIAIPDIIIGRTIYEIKSEYTFDPINMRDKCIEYNKCGYSLTLVLEKNNIIIKYPNDLLTLQ